MENLQHSESQSMTHAKVVFHNVNQSYITSTSIECHYTLTPKIGWSSKDWIGLFKVGCTTQKDYYTFVWSTVPAGYVAGSSANCCVQFQACYLPNSGKQQYQFWYVDHCGKVCGESTPFTFSDPAPMDVLVTLEEDSSSDMLLVLPKAALLEGQLGECKRQNCILQNEKLELEKTFEKLQNKLTHCEELLKVEKENNSIHLAKNKDLCAEKDVVTAEHEALCEQFAECSVRVSQLEEDNKVFREKATEKEVELKRLYEKIKKLLLQLEELDHLLKVTTEEKDHCQTNMKALDLESRRLCGELQVVHSTLDEKEMQNAELKEEIGKLCHKLLAGAENKKMLGKITEQLRCTQDQLSACQQKVVLLEEELASTSSMRDRTVSDLHKSRQDAAELNIKVADLTLKLKEEQIQWLNEKTQLIQKAQAAEDFGRKLSTQVQKLEESLQSEKYITETLKADLSQERDSSKVQLSESHRELKELKSALRVAQKEKEYLQCERQELLEYVKKLEQRLEKMADAKWSESVGMDSPARPRSPATDFEDESPEDMRIHPRLSTYNLCDSQVALEACVDVSQQVLRDQTQEVVISQPVPVASQRKQPSEENSCDSEEDDVRVELLAKQNKQEEFVPFMSEFGHAMK
ncbi:calcium-binding and coiled-coil domain-containing protein 1 [Protopterus annectens]|uniref:calcium-binding and coiled-coil domain-containing protein 1 n=1 Tax=Protopterus annectens TaxID=7888 RepID=UPI001CFA5DF3|nr:calcium-binding and coiled-coil domain-containing protein 1 [Protopterus annectens]XP_043939870.1 calcium-binding and coiled-coil domain-containing protein 1 [Protopterus annectens]XP_043939871.1 calcium-binding and coiled-coil domain-containing protein 1 [Protopterus annectens]